MMLILNDGRSELWQWDTGRKLTVDADCTQVHFSNKVFGRSIDVDVVDGVAIIPDILLQTDKELIAWAFVGTAENGYTKISKAFKVNKRNKPADYVFTPTDQTTLGELVERLEKIEETQDPDAIKSAVDDYLASNPIQIDEKDPTVPAWAKQPQKPNYTAAEVGAQPEGNYVKTVNGETPDKNGNVQIKTTDSEQNAILYTPQELTEEQKAQARKNIGASKVSLLEDFIANTDIDHAYDEATGAYYTVIRVYRDKLDGTKQYPFVYAPNGANAGDKSTLDMVKGDGWLLAINGGVFNTSTKKPDGIVIQNGVVIQNTPTVTHSQCKPLTINRNGNMGYAEYNADANQLVENGIVSAVCGFIPIIVDYNAVPQSEWNNVSNYTENAQRQIIGQWGNGDYAIITCEGRGFHNSDGWKIAEAQTICRKHGLKFAYNLDGGGSTETMLGLKPVNTIYENTTGRVVPTFIVFNGTTVPPATNGSYEDPICYEILMNHSITYYGYDGVGGTLNIDTNNRITALSSQYSPKLPYRNSSNDAVTGEISEYAPIALPDGAESITIVCPGFVPAVTLWTTDGEKWTRTADPGWMALGGGTYNLPTNAKYTHYAVNFKNSNNSTIAPDTDTSGISIVVK